MNSLALRMERAVSVYEPSRGQIRTMTQENGEIMFVGKDVATALGYKNPSNALQVHVYEEDKTSYLIQVYGSNYKTNTLFINESGLYSLILSSQLPQAKAFKRWVTSEVLPQIRKTGATSPQRTARTDCSRKNRSWNRRWDIAIPAMR